MPHLDLATVEAAGLNADAVRLWLRDAKFRNQKLDRIRIGHAGRAGIHQMALDADGFEFLIELHAEVRGVSRIFLLFPDRRRNGVVEENRGIIGSGKLIGGILLDPRQDLPAVVEKLLERGDLFRLVTREAERVTTLNTVRCPFPHLLGIQRGLRAEHAGTGKTC